MNHIDQKITTSKKIALFSAICFAVVIIFVIAIFIVCAYTKYTLYDTTIFATLITVTGAAFGTSAAFYYNKSRVENIIKLKIAFLEEKYKILKETGVLDLSFAVNDIQTEINSIDNDGETELCKLSEDITYNN